MATFRDSGAAAARLQPGPPAPADARFTDTQAVHDRAIGEIIREAKGLTDEQVERILKYQRDHGLRFGESAVALGLASDDDVLFALAQQFHYPYAPENRRELNPELVTAARPFSQQSEAFRAIRSQVMMRVFNGEDQRRALAVVSANSGDGKTFFTANLAVVLSQLGGRTLCMDADLRGPRLHEVFGVTTTAGLSGLLSGRAESNVIVQVPDLPSLFLLPVGITPPNPQELVERPAFGILMRELLLKFDHVVIDTPAAEYGADSSVIAAKAGAAIVIARRGLSRMGALQDLVANVADTPTRLAGVIMNEY
jgi:chain length determinant protein tyrosine kinase EpsG